MRTLTCLLLLICYLYQEGASQPLCETCTSDQLQICHSPAVPCWGKDQVCMNVAINVSLEIFSQPSIFRRICGNRDECDLQGTMSGVNANYSVATTCCNTSSCTPTLPTYLPLTEKKSGLLCPTNFSSPDRDNPVEYIMECKEHETQCITYYDIIKTKTFVSYHDVSGCASKDVCKMESLIYRTRNSTTFVSCTEALPKNSLTPSFFQRCKFQHGKIKKPLSDLCLPDEVACLAERTWVAEAGGVVYEAYSQRCAKPQQCDLFIAVSNPQKTIIIHTTCCHTQHCSPPTPHAISSLPKFDNGLTCRSCYSGNSSECHSNNTVNCTGIMERCVTYTVTTGRGLRYQTETVIGCGTKDACTYGWSFIGTKYHNLQVNITCTGRGNIVHGNMLIMMLIASIVSAKLS